jgi:hypothetical protein
MARRPAPEEFDHPLTQADRAREEIAGLVDDLRAAERVELSAQLLLHFSALNREIAARAGERAAIIRAAEDPLPTPRRKGMAGSILLAATVCPSMYADFHGHQRTDDFVNTRLIKPLVDSGLFSEDELRRNMPPEACFDYMIDKLRAYIREET